MSSQVTGLVPEDGAAGEFGANEWLVDEMYERYKVDKESVDRSWWPILENYRAPVTDPTPTAVLPVITPDTVVAETPAATTTTGAIPVARTTSVQAKPQPIPAEAPTTAAAPVAETAEAAEPQDETAALKGASKALAANMDASLTVPTATSVRTIPAKLMIDNRIVINNHLKRARGGKVSFTHLIAWAIVQTLKEFPSQNVYYDEPDGKIGRAHV